MEVSAKSNETLMVALGIANFVTLVVYYLTLFDGMGTVNPRWTSVLGKL